VAFGIKVKLNFFKFKYVPYQKQSFDHFKTIFLPEIFSTCTICLSNFGSMKIEDDLIGFWTSILIATYR